MKLKAIIIIIIFVLFCFTYIGINKIETTLLDSNDDNNEGLVYVKYFTNSDCLECTNIEDYLEVYKKAGVRFGDIGIKEYKTEEYKINFDKYNIKKLPFIVFSEELNNYDTISNSWDNTFGYKNNDGEFIVTDIIPPYFDLKTKNIEGLIDITYIGNNSCKECYSSSDIINILGKFGLKFNNIISIDNKSQKALSLKEKYNIENFPIVILSKNTELYKNFSYFWKTIGSIEDDGVYILRESGKIGLFSK